MFKRILGLMALATIACTSFMPSAAEAGPRWLRFLQPNYYTYYPGDLDYYDPDYEDEDAYYYVRKPRRFVQPRDSYYEPDYIGPDDEPVYTPPKKKKKTVKAAPVTKPITKKSTVTAKKSTTQPTAKSASMSCDKAEKIVSGYGFSSIKPTTCQGQIYAFNATRGGKSYLIKLSAASGELTEVKKVQ